MIQAIDRQQIIIEKLPNLTTEQQQQVLDFIEFLQFKSSETRKTEAGEPEQISFLEAAKEFVGCVEGPRDLSMRKKDLKRKFNQA
jgi:hypothetical protein